MEFFWKSDNERQTLSKMVVKVDYFANLSWIALYDWMKICEWLLGSEYDVIIGWCIFFFTWIVRSCMLNYVKKLILVNAYVLIDWDVVGE